jgi:radical SAM protein with 4Fe4S-binding SPASM domain
MTELPADYGSLMRELLSRAAKERQPANGTFELTSRCNLSCRMCYIRHAAGDRTCIASELPASAWLELARQAKDNGMAFLLLTGGEIFLRRDFFEIYEPLTRLGLILTLFSNGTLITKEIAARLAQAPPSRTEITLYGATAATYEAVTGISGSYAACCAGIEALVSNRVPLGLKTTITRHNVHELEAMRRMAHNWGVPFSGAWMLSERRDGGRSDADNCRLPARESVALEATDQASANEMMEAALRELPTENAENFYCHAGKSSFVVNPTGEMNACIMLPSPGARPLEINFNAAWQEVQQYVDAAPPPSQTCLNCNVRVFCGRCPAWSLMDNGTLTEPVPYLCEVARARQERYEGAARHSD